MSNPNQANQTTQLNIAPEKVLKVFQYFWGEVINHGSICTRVALLEGKRMPDGKSLEVSASCSTHQNLALRDRALFLFTTNRAISYFGFVQAQHIGFGEKIQGLVTKVDKHGAELILSNPFGGDHVLSDVQAVLSRSAYALNDDKTVIVPVPGEKLYGLIVEKVDPRKKLVYVSLRPEMQRLSKLQAALNRGAAVQIVESKSVSHNKNQIEFTQI